MFWLGLGSRLRPPVWNRNRPTASDSKTNSLLSVQVTAIYQWWKFTELLCPAGKTILRLNLDETAMRTWMHPGKGLMCKPGPTEPRRLRRFTPASRKQARGCLTHVAIICDRPEIQIHLPHVLIANESVLPLYIQRDVEPQLHRNVFLARRKSAWVDAAYMVKIIQLLGTILKPFLGEYQPVLLMDALGAHITDTVFRAATRFRIWVLIVPAKLTWLLQPADTHLFYRYKMHLKKCYREAMARSPDGALDLRHVLLAMNDAVRYVCQAHDWSKAFNHNGFGQHQRLVRRSIVEAAGFTTPMSVPSILPNLAQFRSIWPAGVEVPLDAVFSPILAPPQPSVPSAQGAPRMPQASHEEVPWSERLRPRRSGSFVFPPVHGGAASSPSDSLESATPEPWPVMDMPPSALLGQHQARARPARPIAASRPLVRRFEHQHRRTEA